MNECIVTRKYNVEELLKMEEKDPEKLDKLLNPVKLSGCGKSICELKSNACSPLCLKDTNIHLLKDSIVYVALPLLWNHIHREVLGDSYTRIYE